MGAQSAMENDRPSQVGRASHLGAMMKSFRKAGLAGLRLFLGLNLIHQRTGKVVGRVVVVRWKEGLRVIGLEGGRCGRIFCRSSASSIGCQTWGYYP